jgi:hypothetical protein
MRVVADDSYLCDFFPKREREKVRKIFTSSRDDDDDDDDCAHSSVSLFLCLSSLVLKGCVFYVCFLEEDVVVLFRRSVLLETTYGFGGIEIFRVFFNARYYARFIPTFR